MLICKLTRISDGDTIVVKCGEETELRRVRFAEIDAPEMAQPFGRDARQWLFQRLQCQPGYMNNELVFEIYKF